MSSPYTLSYPERRRALLSSFSPCVSDFPRFPRRPPSLPPSPSLPSSPSSPSSPAPAPSLASITFPYPVSLPSSIHPRIPPVAPDTLGLGIAFNDPNLQARVWALEQVDDPAFAELDFLFWDGTYDDYDESNYDGSGSDDDGDDGDEDDDDDDHWDHHHDHHGDGGDDDKEDEAGPRGSSFRRRVRKFFSLPVRFKFVWRKRFLRRA